MEMIIFMLKFKKIIAVIAVISLTLTLTSCGGKTAQNNTDTAMQKLTVWGANDDQTMLGEMINDFKSKFTDFKNDIERKVTGEDKAAEEALKDIDAAADVFAISHDQLGSLVSAGAVYEISGEYKSKITEQCSENSVAAATYDGKLYGFPSSAETYLLYYDKSKLSAEDVKSLTTILKKDMGSNVYKFGMNFKEGYYGSSIFFTAGCTLFGKNGDDKTSCSFNNENGVKAAEFIKSLKSKNVLNCDENEALTQIKAGKLASYVTGPWKADAMKQALGDNYGVVKLPTANITGDEAQMKSFAGYKIYVVNAKTKDPANAMKLAQHLTSEENQLKRFKSRELLPVNKNVARLDEVNKDMTIKATLDQLNFAVPMPSIPQVSKYWTAFKSFTDDCFNGNIETKDIKSKLDAMVKQITA